VYGRKLTADQWANYADLAEKYVHGESPVRKFKGVTLALALDDRDRHYLRHIAELTLERDTTWMCFQSQVAATDQMRAERDALAVEGHRLFVEVSNRYTLAEVAALLAAKDARIAELKSELATRPAAFVDPLDEPMKPNPFREHPSDRRRIGA
jgi:hypothetical protein